MLKIFKSLFSIVAIATIAGGVTWSYFSDTATSKSNSFKSGILSINDGKVAETDAIVLDNIAPGWVSEEFVVTIENNGSIDLGWLGDWQFSGGISGDDNYDLKDALYIADAKMEFLKSDSSTVWLDEATNEKGYTNGADVFITNGDGSGPYPNYYQGLADSSTFGVISLNEWNNNTSMVTTGEYEQVGALKPGYTYKLTFKFGMAEEAGNQYQNLGPVTAKLKVDATQIEKNQIEALTGGWSDINWMNNQISDQTE
jgi:predicted ribosomally synthesized peptide with SipW-like signal peptide